MRSLCSGAVGILKEIITVESRRKVECLVSRCLAEKLPAAADRFGASDCSCRTHLYFASTEKHVRNAVEGAIRKVRKSPDENNETFEG